MWRHLTSHLILWRHIRIRRHIFSHVFFIKAYANSIWDFQSIESILNNGISMLSRFNLARPKGSQNKIKEHIPIGSHLTVGSVDTLSPGGYFVSTTSSTRTIYLFTFISMNIVFIYSLDLHKLIKNRRTSILLRIL